jgi:hypothetical protein
MNHMTRREMMAEVSRLVVLVGAGRVSSIVSSEWDIENRLMNLTPGSQIDLSLTLPHDVLRGGVFSVDPAGAELPHDLSLSEAGLLEVAAQADCAVSGVVFVYTEPVSVLAWQE